MSRLQRVEVDPACENCDALPQGVEDRQGRLQALRKREPDRGDWVEGVGVVLLQTPCRRHARGWNDAGEIGYGENAHLLGRYAKHLSGSYVQRIVENTDAGNRCGILLKDLGPGIRRRIILDCVVM